MKKTTGYREEQTSLLKRGFVRKMAFGMAVWSLAFAAWLAAVDTLIAPYAGEAISARCPWVAISKEDADLEGLPWYEDALRHARAATIAQYAALLKEDETSYSEASDAARAIADQAVARPQPENTVSPSNDAAIKEALDSMNEETTRALFEEACAKLDIDPSAIRLSLSSPGEYGQSWRTAYFADGHMEYWDLRLYDFVKSLRIPMAMILYSIGVVIITIRTFEWVIRQFDSLFKAMEALFSGSNDEFDLPRELTPTAHALEALRRQRDDAERATLAAEQRKNELVAYLAHDIRTPLTSIVGYLTLLSEAPDMPEEQRSRYARIALDRSYRLESMMEEFFEITRYNLGSIPIERQRFDAALLCRQVADEFHPQANARGIDIKTSAAEPIDCFADAEKISRILNNLLKNAVAYADEGSDVEISARSEADELVIEVKNQGREIGPEHLQAIFEKFYREDGARASNQGGAGLGLAIAREIARAHGGELTARSNDGRTVFALRVPIS